jgi:hypothetical protein
VYATVFRDSIAVLDCEFRRKLSGGFRCGNQSYSQSLTLFVSGLVA